MKVTIDLLWVFYAVGWYVGLGVAIAPALLYLANSNTSPRTIPWWTGLPRALVACAVAWPLIIWDLWMTPRRNRKAMARWREHIRDGGYFD